MGALEVRLGLDPLGERSSPAALALGEHGVDDLRRSRWWALLHEAEVELDHVGLQQRHQRERAVSAPTSSSATPHRSSRMPSDLARSSSAGRAVSARSVISTKGAADGRLEVAEEVGRAGLGKRGRLDVHEQPGASGSPAATAGARRGRRQT